MPAPPNVSTSGNVPASASPGSAPQMTGAERDFALMRWRVCMTELRFWADKLGWEDRLPQKQN